MEAAIARWGLVARGCVDEAYWLLRFEAYTYLRRGPEWGCRGTYAKGFRSEGERRCGIALEGAGLGPKEKELSYGEEIQRRV